MKQRVLGISGKRFSGKDTLAALMVAASRARGDEVVTHAFAGESKRMFVEREHRRGATVDLGRLQTDREYKEVHRPQLTEFTMAALAADPLVFCRSVADRIALDPRTSIITDVRLRLEVEYLRTRFALHLVRLTRSDRSRWASGWRHDSAVDGHRTEVDLDDPSLWDEVVANDGTLDDLDASAARLSQRRQGAAVER